MGRQRICAYCGNPISWLTSILFNNCCSYKCDTALEKEMRNGKPQPAPNKYNKNHTNVALNPKFINNEDEEYDYGFECSNFDNRRNEVFYPQIDNPVEGFDFIKKETIPVEIKHVDPYKRGEHYENKRSGYYDDIDGKPNYYDNGEIGFYSNRNPGYYDSTSSNDDCENDNCDNYHYDDYAKSNDDDNIVEDIDIRNDDEDYNSYNEDEDYQIMHDDNNYDDER